MIDSLATGTPEHKSAQGASEAPPPQPARRLVCLLVALVLVSACGSSRHQAHTQSGNYDSGLKARAAEFVTALNAKDSHQLEDLVSPSQKKDVPAFLAA